MLQRWLRSPLSFSRVFQGAVENDRPDIIHDHGVWLPSNWIAARISMQERIPLVISPRGMLTPWALGFNSWKKKIAWHLYQRWTLEQADLFHVTAANEASALRDLGLTRPIAVIPNGVDAPNIEDLSPNSVQKRVLFLSRVHPKKGLPTLLDAWARIRPESWTLEIVGPSEGGHRATLEAQADELGIGENCIFSGPVSDGEKWKKYAEADLFVLPSHSENFGIVVAEALAAGVPVLTTKGTPWQELHDRNCGWWIDLDVDTLASTIETALSLSPKTRSEMGQRGRKLIEEKYTWSTVASKMVEAYSWVKNGGAPPSFIDIA